MARPHGAALGDWASRTVGNEGESFSTEERTPDASVRVKKQGVLYLHVLPDGEGYQTQYECRDCPMFIADVSQCTIHGPEDVIMAHGSCGFFVPGPPTSSEAGSVAHSNVTVQQSGYVENPAQVGFSCKRCVHYVIMLDEKGAPAENGGCNIVDYNSPGDNPGSIHPDACCTAHELDPERGALESEDFARQQSIRQA